jgi:hypothetical protein
LRCGVLLVANCYHSHNNDCYILNISESCYHSSALHHRKIERERERERVRERGRGRGREGERE